MKKYWALMVIGGLLMSTITTVYAATETSQKYFSDVCQGNWAYSAITAMSENGILAGYPDGTFQPNNTVTYGQFIKMAMIAATNEDIGNSSTGNWAASYYNQAVELKYFGKTNIQLDQLNSKMPRCDMALIISNILGDTKIENYDKLEQSISDVDAKTKNDYDIIKSYASGILTGYSDGTFKPNGTLTRAEAVTVIYRLVDESKRVLPGTTTTAPIKIPTTEIPLDQMITNYKTFLNDDGSIDKLLSRTESYTIDNDGASYGMTLHENKGTKWIEFPENIERKLGVRYLIKDHKVITLVDMGVGNNMQGVGIYNSDIVNLDITTVDYIGSLRSDNNMLLIANPFKK